uniref:hypothetical protein n=1 Tax=Erythrobacter donghaensis TaxID=267135 RepID=UPI000AA6FA40
MTEAPAAAFTRHFAASRAMLVKGSGELSGTSMIVIPSATSASPTATASSGGRPRRIATSGQAAKWRG